MGLSELAAVPKLLVDQLSELGGSAVLRVEGVEGQGFSKTQSNRDQRNLQNSLELLNSSGDSLGAMAERLAQRTSEKNLSMLQLVSH